MVAILEKPTNIWNTSRFSRGSDLRQASSEHQSPLEVRDESIVIDPNAMVPGEYYLATLDGIPYLYHTNAEGEIEVYGLADY